MDSAATDLVSCNRWLPRDGLCRFRFGCVVSVFNCVDRSSGEALLDVASGQRTCTYDVAGDDKLEDLVVLVEVDGAGFLDPERTFPSLFEPVHGSAPDIAGRGIANPIGQIWCASMMLEHLGEPDAAAAVLAAVETVLARGGDSLTPDLGGTATTETLGRAVADAVTAP